MKQRVNIFFVLGILLLIILIGLAIYFNGLGDLPKKNTKWTNINDIVHKYRGEYTYVINVQYKKYDGFEDASHNIKFDDDGPIESGQQTWIINHRDKKYFLLQIPYTDNEPRIMFSADNGTMKLVSNNDKIIKYKNTTDALDQDKQFENLYCMFNYPVNIAMCDKANVEKFKKIFTFENGNFVNRHKDKNSESEATLYIDPEYGWINKVVVTTKIDPKIMGPSAMNTRKYVYTYNTDYVKRTPIPTSKPMTKPAEKSTITPDN